MSYLETVSPILNVTVKEIAIKTMLTIAVSPATTVSPGTSLTFTGKLSRDDTGAGIANQKILLKHPPKKKVVAEGITDNEGNYLIQISAPMKQKTYPYRTVFEGTTDLRQSESKILGVGVGVRIPPILIIGGILVSVFLIGVSLFKPTR